MNCPKLVWLHLATLDLADSDLEAQIGSPAISCKVDDSLLFNGPLSGAEIQSGMEVPELLRMRKPPGSRMQDQGIASLKSIIQPHQGFLEVAFPNGTIRWPPLKVHHDIGAV